MVNYQAIIEQLNPEKIKQLLLKLGAEDVIEKPGCFITNTICHNINGGSFKLYYYENSHMFMCYTNCQAMSPFTFLKQYYETRNIEYD